MIVKVGSLSHDLRGIARVNGKVLFVSNTLPGEIVNIRLINERKKFSEGRVISYIEKSNDRKENMCPYFGKCGGCSFGYIDYNKALTYKKNILRDIFMKYCKMVIEPSVIASDEIFGYRNKISLKVNNDHLSLVEDNSNELVAIDKCFLVNDGINNIIKILNSIDLTGLTDVIIRGIDDIMIILKGKYDYNAIIKLLDGKVNSIIYNEKCVYGNEYIDITVGNFKYAIYPDSFFQVNSKMIKKIYDKIKEYAGRGNSLLDLYCGAGTIGIYLAENFKSVRGIETNSDAIRSANLNKVINSVKNISFECKNANDVSNIIEDVVVVDPPRNGLNDKTRKLLLGSDVEKIVYVSCNPVTLARDVDILREKYDLKDVTLFDNFPNTRHMESIVVLERK